jgi:hypothetical protein
LPSCAISVRIAACRLLGLVARRGLLRVRAHAARHEREREALIRVLPRREAAGER